MKVAEIKVDYINHCGDDLSVVNAARVSFDKESFWVWDDNYQEYIEGVLKPHDAKLINYLAKHKHKSPFNHAFISVRVKAPVFVARQLVKHKFMPWNEVSRRYVDSEPEFYFPNIWRGKADNVKQGSTDGEFSHPDFLGSDAVNKQLVEDVLGPVLDTYNEMIQGGLCAEQARMVLPQNVMTEWIWSGTLGAFADMLTLRLSPYTQAETRVVAEQIKEIVEQRFPVSLKALLDNA